MAFSGENYRSLPPGHLRNYGSVYSHGSSPYGIGNDVSSVYTTRPPTLPPKNQSYMQASSYSSGYNRYLPSYQRPLYNSYSPYNYQSYGMPGLYNQTSYAGSSFIEEAQMSSREAFSSIESVVGAFSSINMMIESTYCALQSSFNAVLAVAENLSKMKMQLGHILSAFSIIRTVQYLCRKLLYYLGVRRQDPANEAAWKNATRPIDDLLNDPDKKKSSWPVIMFFIAVYAAPFLMWKFVRSIIREEEKEPEWTKENGQYYYGIAKFNYEGQTPDELTFKAGDVLRLAPFEKQRDKNWPLASNGTRVGTVPINYIDIKLNSGGNSSSKTPKNDSSSDLTATETKPVNDEHSQFEAELSMKEDNSIESQDQKT